METRTLAGYGNQYPRWISILYATIRVLQDKEEYHDVCTCTNSRHVRAISPPIMETRTLAGSGNPYCTLAGHHHYSLQYQSCTSLQTLHHRVVAHAGQQTSTLRNAMALVNAFGGIECAAFGGVRIFNWSSGTIGWLLRLKEV